MGKRVVAIIQARMGSTRLPGKVLSTVAGVPLLQVQLRRVQKAKMLDQVVVATTVERNDDSIVSLCEDLGVAVYRGSEDDVLGRYFEAAKLFQADSIVRLTADCPLVDPEIIDGMLSVFNDGAYDYYANTIPIETSRFPDGSDVEIFSFSALENAEQNCKDAFYREHVTFYFWKDDRGFRTGQFMHVDDLSSFRLTVDYPEDLNVIGALSEHFGDALVDVPLARVTDFLERNPDVKKFNQLRQPGEGWCDHG